ncbi:hypothetical protein [Massilibacteroides sp.]|uniref:hypothetical protein n=1 Tax=Massilibacteroides sp. TaxID=2034766 RepID=UPI00261116A0|nr:hypothetical protein [Massilibacteroides sp.]MDD4515649.1 hypothetical protein [Massilibacteroides sp.]
MELNNKNLEVLSAELKMDKEALINAIIKADAPELKLPERVVYEKSEFDTYIKNLTNQEYHKGKTAGDEMSLKEVKKFASDKYGIVTEGIKTHAEVIELIEKKKSEEYKSAFEGEKDSKVKELLSKVDERAKEVELLQKRLLDTETDYKSQLSAKEMEVKNQIISKEIASIQLPFDIPKNLISNEEKTKYVQTENIKFLTLLKSMYDFDTLDGSIVIKQNGEVLKDKFLNPVKYNAEFAIDFAKKMNINIQSNGTIQRPDGTRITNNFTGSTKEQFNEIMKEKGIVVGSNDYVKYYSEWLKSQQS